MPLAGAIILKTYPALLLISLITLRRYRALGLTVAAIAGIVLCSALILPPTVWHDWWSDVLPTGGYAQTPARLFSPAAPRNQSINGWVARLFLPNTYAPPLLWPSPTFAQLLPYVIAVILLAVAAILLWRLAQIKGIDAVDDSCILLLLTMFMIAPFSWEGHLVYVLPAVLILGARVLAPGESWWMRLLVLGCAVVLAIWIDSYTPMLQNKLLVLALSAKLYAVCGLWIAEVIFIQRVLRRPADSGATQTAASSIRI